MAQRTYVCLECRRARRAEAAYGLKHDFRCAGCSKSLHELPSRRRIPVKRDDAGWKELAALVARIERDRVPGRDAVGLEKLAELERKMAAADSETIRRKLRSEVRRVRRLYGV